MSVLKIFFLTRQELQIETVKSRRRPNKGNR